MFQPALASPLADPVCYLLVRSANRLLGIAAAGDAGGRLPFVGLAALPSDGDGEVVPVGQWQGRPCFARDMDTLPSLPGAEPLALREVYATAGPEAFALAGRAVQLLDWQRNHRFCGHCGTATVRLPGETAMVCTKCGLQAYPRISPAVMVLIRKGRQLLLARSPRFKPGVYSALAGFVEAGETLEECAVREVREEVGLEIAQLRYFSSQSWPFPNSLMVAFFAEYSGGCIVPEPGEIEAADWFFPESLPLLPDPLSISRRLIEAALAELRT